MYFVVMFLHKISRNVLKRN